MVDDAVSVDGGGNFLVGFGEGDELGFGGEVDAVDVGMSDLMLVEDNRNEEVRRLT